MRKGGFIDIWIVFGIVALIALAGGYFIVTQQSKPVITNFEECAAAGYPIMESYPEQCRTPDGRTFVRIIPPQQIIPTQNVSFGSQFTLVVSETATFNDGPTVTLVEINDSRCKPEVVCVWAGELSLLLRVTSRSIGSSGIEVRLGTVTATSAGAGGYLFTLNGATETTATITVTKTKEPAQIACTLEAKLCPDGSAVGRTGPNCEFAPCPPVSGGTQVTLREGERRGPLLVQNIFPTYLTGLVYREYPVATDQGEEITMYIGDIASNGCTHTLTLIRVENGSATFTENIDNSRLCPICLAEGTLIDTPSGKIAVQDLKIGDEVWTIDLLGNRISAPLLAVGKTNVPLMHQVVHLKLADSRELFVSPGHPTADGRFIGSLLKGDILGGSAIVEIERVEYSKAFTYDVLPGGGTGMYFANGILIGSTLK